MASRKKNKLKAKIQKWYDRAVKAFHARDYSRAVKLLKKVIKNAPNYTPALNALSVNLRRSGRPREALPYLQKAITLDPNNASYHNNLGNLYNELNQLDRAEAELQLAIELDPEYVQAIFNLGLVYKKKEQWDLARKHFKQAIEKDNAFIDPYIELAAIEITNGNYEQAKKILYKCMEFKNVSDYPQIFDNLGCVHRWEGDKEKAICYFNKSIKSNPDYFKGYYDLVHTQQNNQAETKDIATYLEEILSNKKDKLSLQQLVYIHFALGRIYHDWQDYELAFEHFAKGNKYQYQMSKNPYNPQKNENALRNWLKILTPEFFSLRKNFGLNTKKPIFIVGMPRSGTTLTEQILASHPRVEGAGELTRIEENLNKLRRRVKAPNRFHAALSMDLLLAQELATDYLDHISNIFPETEFITDKMPFNFRLLWFIYLLFPQCKIIHIQRNPLDTCLSCFLTSFVEDHSFTNDLKFLAHYYSVYVRLMQYWHKILPTTILDVRYENLVTNPEQEIKRILDFCELEWHDDCMNFYKKKRSVLTASAMQVRNKLYTSAINKWKRYASQLEPLRQELINLIPSIAEELNNDRDAN